MRGDGGVEVGRPADGGERRRRDAEVAEERLLGQPLLSRLEGTGRRVDRHAAGQEGGRLDGDVLELVGDGLDAGGELVEGVEVDEVGPDVAGGDGGGRVGVRVEDADADSERGGGEGQHAAELAGPEDAEGGGHGRGARVGNRNGSD